jgi:protein tyrosine phosphatase (PTP) superfamily phosphohydrolase (DUF442 family)
VLSNTYIRHLLRSWLMLALIMLATEIVATELPEIPNTKVYSSSLISAGQPDKSQFTEIANSGIQVVINLAPKNLPKSLKNEEKLVQSNGMSYFFIPIDWGKPTQEDFVHFLEVMESVVGKKVLVHCWVNARASAFVYLYRVLRQDQPQDAEFANLERIWESNEGYELRNVPRWGEYLDKILARYRN